jgi:hypothetical protein
MSGRQHRKPPDRRDAEEWHGLAMDRRDAEARAAWTKDASYAMQMNVCGRRPGSTSWPSCMQVRRPPGVPQAITATLRPEAAAAVRHCIRQKAPDSRDAVVRSSSLGRRIELRSQGLP